MKTRQLFEAIESKISVSKYAVALLLTTGALASCNHQTVIDLAPNETAFVYENRTTGELIYCSNEYEHAPAEPRDFIPRGTASVDPSDIRLCELA